MNFILRVFLFDSKSLSICECQAKRCTSQSYHYNFSKSLPINIVDACCAHYTLIFIWILLSLCVCAHSIDRECINISVTVFWLCLEKITGFSRSSVIISKLSFYNICRMLNRNWWLHVSKCSFIHQFLYAIFRDILHVAR